MIVFSHSKIDTKKRVMALAFSQGKVFVILAPIALALGVWYAVFGHIFSDSNALVLGYSAVALSLFMAAIFVAFVCRYKKMVEVFFKRNPSAVEQRFSIERDVNNFKMVQLDNKNTLEFQKSEITKIYYAKKYIIVKLNSVYLLDFPNNADIKNLFANNC